MNPRELRDRALERFDALSGRERWLVAVACVAAVYWVLSFALIDPLIRERDDLVARLEVAADQLGLLEGEAAALTTRLRTGPSSRLARRERELEDALASLETRLSAHRTQLVSPGEATRVVKELVAAERELRLVRLETAAPEPLGVSEAPPGQTADEPALFRHDIELETEGSYFAALRYLEALEAGGSGLQLDRLDYEVTEYPRARMVLRLFTLSFEEAFLGV